MKVNVVNQQRDLSISEESVVSAVRYVLETMGSLSDELSIYFVSTEEISQLHADFFNDPEPTDCITFPMDQTRERGYQFLGEVFVCPQVAIDYLAQHPEEPNDPYRETTLYVVHGCLHLLGFDDIEDEDFDEMKRQEASLLQDLIEKNLLLTAYRHIIDTEDTC